MLGISIPNPYYMTYAESKDFPYPGVNIFVGLINLLFVERVYFDIQCVDIIVYLLTACPQL